LLKHPEDSGIEQETWFRNINRENAERILKQENKVRILNSRIFGFTDFS